MTTAVGLVGTKRLGHRCDRLGHPARRSLAGDDAPTINTIERLCAVQQTPPSSARPTC